MYRGRRREIGIENWGINVGEGGNKRSEREGEEMKGG